MALKKRVLIVGGGWAGLAAAVRASERGGRVTLLEAARAWGGRARALDAALAHAHGGTLPQGPPELPMPLDNGQHILIGASPRPWACCSA